MLSGSEHTDVRRADFGGHRPNALRYGHGKAAEPIPAGSGGTFYDSALYGHIGNGQHCRHHNVRKTNAGNDIADAQHDTTGSY